MSVPTPARPTPPKRSRPPAGACPYMLAWERSHERIGWRWAGCCRLCSVQQISHLSAAGRRMQHQPALNYPQWTILKPERIPALTNITNDFNGMAVSDGINFAPPLTPSGAGAKQIVFEPMRCIVKWRLAPKLPPMSGRLGGTLRAPACVFAREQAREALGNVRGAKAQPPRSEGYDVNTARRTHRVNSCHNGKI